MNHPSEEQLVLHYYGESGDAAEIDRHLAACGECRAAYASFENVLNAVAAEAAPERGPDFEGEVWRRLETRLPRPRRPWFAPPRWSWAPALAALLVFAFFAGRVSIRKPAADGARERILQMAVGEHLERSQRLLLELANARGGDLSSERETAEDLLEVNRLYRQSAALMGDGAVGGLLDDLERILLQVAHSPAPLDAENLQGVLFKVRVTETRMRKIL